MSGLRVLVVGGGAREHALCWRLALDASVADVHVAPGNSGMRDAATVHPEFAATDVDGVCRLATDIRADLVVVGPEAPLAAGLADALAAASIACFGPSRDAAALETSKTFCREVAESIGVPMAEGAGFSDAQAAIRFARRLEAPVAVKADGLAGGKGVTLCRTADEAEAAIVGLGAPVVVERLIEGREASLMAICDGERAVALPAARDYKRLLDGDHGPNTGGMGAYSPLPDLDAATADRLLDVFHRPVLAEMARRGMPFRGVLYAGLMLTSDGPRLLEFNARFGDPEAEVVLPRIRGDLAQALLAAANGELGAQTLEQDAAAAVAVVITAPGYPAAPRTGGMIGGLDAASATGALVLHGGTGRVLTLVGRGPSVEAARESAYAAVRYIRLDGAQYRTDVAAPALTAVSA